MRDDRRATRRRGALHRPSDVPGTLPGGKGCVGRGRCATEKSTLGLRVVRFTRGIVVAILVLPSLASAQMASPRIVVQDRAYDAGTIDAGTVIRHTFTLQNGGNADLHLEVQPGCACTVVHFDETIAPGASGTITARLDTINYTGRITKEIRVKSDDRANGSIGLRLQADVVPALTVTPSARVSLRGTPAELKPVELVLASSDGKPF